MATASPPTRELGSPQRASGWAAPVLDERETARDLAFPQSAITYASMLNDAQLDGLYRGATLPIRAYRWWLDPNGAPPEMVQRISMDYGLPIGETGVMNRRRTQGRFRFDRHLEDALRAIVYGFYAFEQVGDIGPDGLWHLRKLAARPPRTVTQIKPARDGGLEYIRVPALQAQAGPRGLSQAMRGGVELPVSRLIMYVWDQEGANWAGRSMLRSSYRPWKLKDRVMRVGAINIDRAGGVPYIEAPEGTTPTQMAELHALAAAFRVGETAGAALPHGATLKFAAAAGGDQAVNYVRLQNEEMARAWLMMFLQSGQSSSGHGSTEQVGQQIDYFAEVQKAIAGWACDIFTEHQIEDDVEWNEGPEAEYTPLLRFTPHGDPLDALAGELDDAQVAGALPADSVVAATVRRGVRPGSSRRHARMQAQVQAAEATTPADRAQTDFEALQAAYEDAVAQLTATWNGVQVAQIADLHAQIAAATTVEQLAVITPAVLGATAIAAALIAVTIHGAQSAVDEAAAQGAELALPDLADANTRLTAAAGATATLLSRSLGQSAASRALSLWGPDADPAAVADAVQEHLEGLAGQTAAYEFAGLASQAQNEGRFTALEGAPDGTQFYASELNDTNTCTFCDAVDDAEYESMAAARADYPAGGYVGCEGGKRCRGTIVAVYAEA